GTDTLTGGTGNDILNGGAGRDILTGGGGSDKFVYGAVSDSTSTKYDTVHGFDATTCKFDLTVSVTGIDAAVTAGSLSATSFNTDLAAAINSAHLAAGHAVLFTASAGSLSGDTFLIVDANGTAGYQAGQDYVIELAGAAHLTSLSTGNFV
ncbi:MAG TPA: bluetail domain-containing putative surface protein, partial [Rhizomicrobium sp.]|nr:bluetail domain-containing putative surface protein [Rhizomicrobium sp.]